jgi:hypothetical protein
MTLPVDKQVMTYTLVSILNNVFSVIFYPIGGYVVSTDADGGSLVGLTILSVGLTVNGMVMGILYILYQR